MLCCLLAFLALPTLAPARFFGLNARCATGFRAPPPIHVRYKHIYIHVHQFISPSQKVRWLSDFSLPYVLEGARSLCNSLGRWSSLETWHPASLYPAAGLHPLLPPVQPLEAVKVSTTGLIDELIFCHNQCSLSRGPSCGASFVFGVRATSTCRWANMCLVLARPH